MSEAEGTWEQAGELVLGQYRLIRQLGKGGMGAVDLARTEGAKGFQRPVVIKRILNPRDQPEEALERFAREAHITAELRHPGIVSILHFERDAGRYLMVRW